MIHPTVILTRPAKQNEALGALCRSAGFSVLNFPLLEIIPVQDADSLQRAGHCLEQYALVIFISPTAIEHAFACWAGAQPVIWPAHVPIGIIGPGSARALAQCGITPAAARIVVPLASPYDSEGLLAQIDTSIGLKHLAGQRVLLVKGDGGRELLAQTLRAAGAQVDTVLAYQRSVSQPSDMQWHSLCALLNGSPQQTIWVITRSGSLRHLDALADAHLDAAQRAALKQARIVVLHPRIADAAKQLGFDRVTICSASDEAIVSALQEFKSLSKVF